MAFHAGGDQCRHLAQLDLAELQQAEAGAPAGHGAVGGADLYGSAGLQAEFLGVALVLVYVGAVMVLFLFVVMMLDINTAPLREGFARYLPVAATVAGLMFIQMLVLLGVTTGKRNVAFPSADPAAAVNCASAGAAAFEPCSNLEWIGRALFSGYLFPFEVAAVLLTVAILAAVMLTLRRRPGARHQDPAKQSAVRKEDRVRVIKMAAEVRREEGEA